MYQAFWGLRSKPFENTPDPRYFYVTGQHEEALARLEYVIRENKGAGMLSGVFGCGKTLLLRSLIGRLSLEEHRIAVLNVPPRSFEDLFRGVVRLLRNVALPLNTAELSTDALIEILQNILRENQREGRQTVIVVDEAHAISVPEVFEGLRVLMNFQSEDRFDLTLILAGQPELTGMVDDNKPFEQRIAVKAQLQPLNLEETKAYVTHRLKVSGANGELFTSDALELIHRNTGGIPRRINRLCDTAMLAAFAKHQPIVDRTLVELEVHAFSS